MKKARLFIGLLPGILFLLLWAFLVHSDQRLQFLFSSPSLIAEVAYAELQGTTIWNDIFITSYEAILGLLLGSTIGTLIGLLLWTNEAVAKISRPYIVILGSIPIFAIAPMLIIWFGTGLLSKVIMSAFAVFFVALAQAYEGARHCSAEYSQYARTLNASRCILIKKIIVPGALRWVLAGFKMSIGLAIVGAFIGEFVSSQAGLGHYILGAGSLYDMARVVFGVVLISALALTLTATVWLIERWKPHLFAR
jgi:NitT/TauT family transport system permease protein